MNAVIAVVIKEFKDGLRNRWLVSITLIFAILSLGLSYFSGVATGQIQQAPLSSIIASLSSLAVFVIPLIALLLCYDSFVGEQESGTLLLLMTYPLSHVQLLLGKFLGQGLIIAFATFLGFGCAGIALAIDQGFAQVALPFGLFIASAILLGWCFCALAYVISILVNEKSKAAGLALLTWFFFVLVFDLALLGLLVSNDDSLSQSQLLSLMLLNPADIFRLVNLSAIDTSDVNGVLAIAINSGLSTRTLFVILASWTLVPLSLASYLFKRKTL